MGRVEQARKHAFGTTLTAVCAMALLAGTGARAADVGAVPWSVGVFAGEGVQSDLLQILPDAIRGRLDFQPAHAEGLVVRYDIAAPEGMANFGREHDLGVSTSVELSILKMRGLTHGTEVALDWRPAIMPWHMGPVRVEFAWGLGFSHSFGAPWSDYTDPDKPQGYSSLFHMAPEMAFRTEDWSLSLRIHHRSGMYGLFAPRKVGSNHVGLLLMHHF
jgi:hypothetical protein